MNKKITIRNVSVKDRGMFAKVRIRKGEVIEVCPVIVLPLKDKALMDKSHLYNYYFYWGPKNVPAIALGYGSLYNHSYEPNAEYDEDVKNKHMVFTARRDIRAGEEITVNYNGNPESMDPLWFKVK
jgi:uncharacterized protein